MPWERRNVAGSGPLPSLRSHLEQDFQNLDAALAEIDEQLRGAYGGIEYDGPPVLFTATTTPQRVTAFDTAGPARRVDADPLSDTLTPLTGGVFIVSAQVTADIASGQAYTLELYADGAQTNIQASIDASNQTTGTFIALTGLVRNLANAVLELRVSVGSGSRAFNVKNAQFSIARVGI